MNDDDQKPAGGISPPPASPAECPSAAPPKPSLLDNPILISAATGKRLSSTIFKKGNQYGRNTLATPERLVILLNALRSKYSFSGAALAAGVTPRCAYKWKQRDPEIAELVSMAQSTKLEGLIAKLISFANAPREQGKDWRAIAWLLERLPWAHRDLFKRDPNAITPDILAGKISEIVARIIPMLPAERHGDALAVLEEISGSLKPKDEGEGSDGDGR